MPRHPRKPSRFDKIPPGASFEDDVQLDALRQPWSLTFGEFLRVVRERYGFTEHHENGVHYLRNPEGRLSPMPITAALEYQLDAIDTADLCAILGLPPSDLGLPDED